jgi:hypothetical protein
MASLIVGSSLIIYNSDLADAYFDYYMAKNIQQPLVTIVTGFVVMLTIRWAITKAFLEQKASETSKNALLTVFN